MWQDGKIASPSDVRPEKDDPQWYLAWARWIYARYCNNYTLICPGGFIPSMSHGRSLQELRAYGRGQQSVEKYKSRVDAAKIMGEDGKKLGLMNISWDPNQVYRKFREIIIDRALSVEHEPNVVAIDKPSIRKKELAVANDRLAAMPQSKEFFSQVGMLPDGVNEDIMGMRPTDVDVLNQLGGYQVMAEIAIREAVQASLQFSNYSPEIKRQLLEDHVDAAIVATKVVHDAATGRQIVEYVDIAGLIIPNSQYDDCHDIDYVGIIKPKSISALRQGGGLSEEQLFTIAKLYRNTGPNARMDANFGNTTYTPRGMYGAKYNGTDYDQMQVQVMEISYVALDVERHVVGYHRCGNFICDQVGRNSKLSQKQIEKGKSIEDNIIQYVYTAEWIVGSDIVYNFRVDDVVTRTGTPGSMRAVLPVQVHRSNQPSITSACIGAIDDLQLAIYKKRLAITKLPPLPNLAVDMSIMEDAISLGPYKLTQLDLADIYAASGYYFYKSKSEFAGSNEASNRPPLMPIGDNMSNMLQVLQGEIVSAIDTLRLISGVNEMSDGTGNPKDVLNGVAAGFEQASNRSMSGVYTAMTVHFKLVARGLALRYQSVATYGQREMHYLPVASSTVRMLQLYPDLALHDFEISVNPAMDNNSRQMLMQALVSNRDQQKIDEDVFLMVMELIQSGQIQRAQYIMSKGVADKGQRDQQNQIQMMKQQSEAQAGQAQATEQAKQATVAMEGEVVAKQIVLKGEQERITQKEAHEQRMVELQLQSGLSGAAAV